MLPKFAGVNIGQGYGLCADTGMSAPGGEGCLLRMRRT